MKQELPCHPCSPHDRSPPTPSLSGAFPSCTQLNHSSVIWSDEIRRCCVHLSTTVCLPSWNEGLWLYRLGFPWPSIHSLHGPSCNSKCITSIGPVPTIPSHPDYPTAHMPPPPNIFPKSCSSFSGLTVTETKPWDHLWLLFPDPCLALSLLCVLAGKVYG